MCSIWCGVLSCSNKSSSYKSKYEAEIVVLKAEITELKKSQEFLATQYDEIIETKKKQSNELICLDTKCYNLKTDYDNLKAINEKQNRELKSLQENAKDLAKKSTEEAIKLHGVVDQYSIRQNLEFQYINN